VSRVTLVSDTRRVAAGWRWGHRPLTPATAEPHLLVAQAKEFPTGWARTAGVCAAREVVQRAGLAPLLTAEISRQISGREVLDDLSGPVVFMANHASHLDTAVLLTALPPQWRRRTAVAAAADYFFATWWRGVGTALAFNTFPLERRGGRPSSLAVDLLSDGWSLLVFPEGSRTTDGWVAKTRPGTARLAAAAGVPVVPVALRGTFAAMPRGRSWPVPGRPPVRVRFGQPIWPQAGEEPRDLTGRLDAALATLLDEDETDWWQASRRAARDATPSASGPVAATWRRRWPATLPPADREPDRRPTPWSASR
jgi:1-acyl-sn-glycerol-3-phosphate acyltransferase